VVAARSGGLPEIVEDGVTGLLVAPGDTAGLRDALGRLAGDATLRGALGAAGRARAAQFGPELVTHAHEEHYRLLTQGGPR